LHKLKFYKSDLASSSLQFGLIILARATTSQQRYVLSYATANNFTILSFTNPIAVKIFVTLSVVEAQKIGTNSGTNDNMEKDFALPKKS
jgi:hypothetical protein